MIRASAERLRCHVIELLGGRAVRGIVTKIIFPVADMSTAIEFYRALGFDVAQYDDGYAWISHQGSEILHLSKVEALDAATNHAAGYFHVKDVDRWHAVVKPSVESLEEVLDRPWGMREFSFHDPSGNLLRFGQNL
jgi:catechol 2,3-dioxygenase-like lactoylglutathione lyase family enzyme